MHTGKHRTLSVIVVLAALVGSFVALAPPQVNAATAFIDEHFDGSSWHTSSTWHNWIGGYMASGVTPGITGDGTRITMKKGKHEAAMLNHQLAGSPDEAWFRYWMRFEDLPEDTGKLPGLMGLYSDSARGQVKPSSSKPGWSARVLFGPGDAGANVKLGYYVYHLDQSQAYGDGLWWSKQVPLDRWVCLEGRVAMNTPGVGDGVLEAWIDGQPVFSRTDLRYRAAGQSDVHVKEFMFEVYYGGSKTPSVDTSVSFDELVVADTRIGCGGPGGAFEDTAYSPFVDDIRWLAATGITKGCNPPVNTRFCPDASVTRGQMAAFLHRALDDLVTVPPLPPDPPDPPTFWGVEVADYSAALSTMSAAGRPIDLVHVEHSLSGGDWLATGPSSRSGWVPLQMSNIINAGAVPFIEFYDADIGRFVAGDHDTEFNAWADIVTGWLEDHPGNRALIVPFPDANNRNVSYGDSASAFIAAYRKVHDAIRSRGIGPDQARFVYQMSAELNSTRYAKADVGSGYGVFSPGSSYIDLAAVSWLNDGTPVWDDWESLYRARVDEMNDRVGDDVPVLLSVVGSAPAQGGETRADWLDGIAAGVVGSPTAVGFLYLDKDRNVAYGVGTDTSPEAGLLAAIDKLGSPNDRLEWLFTNLDSWKAQRRAASISGMFADDDTSVFESDIAWLARAGITKGCAPDRYCPDAKVTRGQMAAFIHRALGSLITPSGSPPSFVDTAASPFASDISWLAATGITKGCNPPANDRFCPDASVTRGQMAAFLHRALRDLLG